MRYRRAFQSLALRLLVHTASIKHMHACDWMFDYYLLFIHNVRNEGFAESVAFLGNINTYISIKHVALSFNIIRGICTRMRRGNDAIHQERDFV